MGPPGGPLHRPLRRAGRIGGTLRLLCANEKTGTTACAVAPVTSGSAIASSPDAGWGRLARQDVSPWPWLPS
jgi:hypothetical protein